MLRGLACGAIAGRLLAFAMPMAMCDSSSEKKPAEMVAVYLKPESKQLIAKSLSANKQVSNAVSNYVCVNPHAASRDVHVYRPLFGTRAAFRLRTLVLLPSGHAVGMGRLSNMAGDIKDDAFEVSMPIFSGNSATVDPSIEQLLRDLPTLIHSRLPNVSSSKTYWKGSIPGGKVGNNSYSKLNGVQIIHLPANKQVVVDGYLCSNLCVNSEGKCEFVPEPAEEEVPVADGSVQGTAQPPPPSSNTAATATNNTSELSQADPDNSECPVCKYMKGGSCKDNFLAWDNCVRSLSEEDDLHKCFQPTKNMMDCMRKDEYYDIMTAGTDFDRLDAAAAASSAADHKDGEEASPQ